MEINSLDRRYNAYHWRYELTLVKKIALALGMAGIIGLSAQIRIPVPWSVVPITGQTLAVLLAGVLLGRWWGGLSLAMYVGLGASGLPWFTGWAGGVSHLVGPTGGYIVGFILAALFVGHFTDKPKARSFSRMLGLMLLASILIYIPGLLQLYMWLNTGGTASFYQVLAMGFIPFIVGDLIKAMAATGIAWRVIKS